MRKKKRWSGGRTLKPAVPLQLFVVGTGHHGRGQRDNEGAGVADVAHVSLRLSVDLVCTVVDDQLVEFGNLGAHGRWRILGVLKEDAAHHDFQCVAVLFADDVLFVGTRVHPCADSILDNLDVFARKIRIGEWGVFPNALRGVAKGGALPRRNWIVHAEQRRCVRGLDVHSTIVDCRRRRSGR